MCDCWSALPWVIRAVLQLWAWFVLIVAPVIIGLGIYQAVRRK